MKRCRGLLARLLLPRVGLLVTKSHRPLPPAGMGRRRLRGRRYAGRLGGRPLLWGEPGPGVAELLGGDVEQAFGAGEGDPRQAAGAGGGKDLPGWAGAGGEEIRQPVAGFRQGGEGFGRNVELAGGEAPIGQCGDILLISMTPTR